MEIISGRKTSTRKKNTPISPMVDLGKLQPQARDLEEAVLGALMLEKDAYSIISDISKPECFYEYKHQLIYTAIVDLGHETRAYRHAYFSYASSCAATGNWKR